MPNITSSAFSDDGLSIRITFDADTDRGQGVEPLYATEFNCANLVVFPDASLAKCSWITRASLFAKLHVIAPAAARRRLSIVAADSYTVNVVALAIRPRCLAGATYACSRRPYSSEENVVAVQLPANPAVPYVSLSASAKYVSCDDIVLDPSASNGDAGVSWLSIAWSVRGTGDVRFLEEYLNAEAVTDIYSAVALPNNFSQRADNFIVTLTLTNFFSRSSNSSIQIFSADGNTRPNTGIAGSSTRVLYRDESFKLSSNASVPECLGLKNKTLSYVWKVFEMKDGVPVVRKYKSTSNDPRRFHFAPYTFNSSTTYIVQVTVFLVKTPTVNSSYAITVDILRRVGTSTAISGGDLRTISATVPWTLDASSSFHLDYPAAPLTYFWTCVQVYPAVTGNVCNATFQTNAAIVSFSGLYQTELERRWIFSVVTGSQLDSVTSNASTVIIISPVDPPVVTFGVLPVKQNPEATFTLKSLISVYSPTSVTAAWSVLDSDFDIADYATTALERQLNTGNQQLFSLAISPNFFFSGRIYTLQLSLTSSDGSVSWINQAKVVINSPPYGGVLEISPSRGLSLNTTFYMKTNSWRTDSENMPLLYEMNYYTSDPAVISVLLYQGTVRQVNALLGAGSESLDYVVTCVVTATDVFTAQGSTSETVAVEPITSAVALSGIVNSLLDDAADDADTDRVSQVSSAASQSLDSKNCSMAPNCTDIFRKSCSSVPHTCSGCIDGYYGSATGNTACVSTDTSGSGDGRRLLRGSRRALLTASCSATSDCDVDQVCANSVCTADKQTCPGDCSENGQCVAVDSTSTVIPECLVSDLYCSVSCVCDPSFYGTYCEYTADEIDAVISLRERLCSVNSDILQYLDSSLSSSLSTATIIGLLLQDVNQLTDMALDTCTTVIFETIAANPELAADDSLLTLMLEAISNALATDPARTGVGVVREEILKKMEAAVQKLLDGAQTSLPAGLSKTRVTKNLRVLISKHYPSDLMGKFYSLPTTDLEAALGAASADVVLEQSSPSDTTEVAVSVTQVTNNPSGASVNATGVAVQTLFYSQISAASGNQTSVRTVLINLQNVRPVTYQGSEATVLTFECDVNVVNGSTAPYRVPVACGEEMLSVVCPGNESYVVQTTCIPAHEAPRCMTLVGAEYVVNPRCVVVNYTADSTTCSCAEDFLVSVADRYVLNPTSTNFASTLGIIGTSFVSRFDTVNSLSLATLANNKVIVGFMAGVLGFLIFGGFWFLFLDYKYVSGEAIRDREMVGAAAKKKKAKKASESPSFLRKVIPHQFTRKAWYRRYWDILKTDWSFMAFVYTRHGRDYRYYTLTWVLIIGKLINFMFVGTVVAVLFFSDDAECGKFTSKSECIKRLGLDFKHNLCIWDTVEESCHYNEFHTSLYSTLIATLVIQVLVAPIDAMLNHFLLMIKCLLVAREDNIRKEILVTSPELVQRGCLANQLLSRSQSGQVLRQAKYMLAARFEIMKRTIDFLDPYNELFVMVELARIKAALPSCPDAESRKKLNSLRSTILLTIGDFPRFFPGETKTLSYKAFRTVDTINYMLRESVKNRPAYLSVKERKSVVQEDDKGIIKVSSLSELLSDGQTRYLLRNIKLARRVGDEIVTRMDSFPDDETREVYLMRSFIVETMVGYRRAVAERFFFEEAVYGIRSGIYSSKGYQRFCLFMVPMYLLFFCFYVFLFGISIGTQNTEIWLVSIIISFFEDTLLVEPVAALFYGIFVASLAYKDVTVMATRVFSRVNSITNRVLGQMNPTAAYLQHLNPACRAARSFPHLHSARLLMSLNDDDIPSSYMSRYYRKGAWDGAKQMFSLLKAVGVLVFISVIPGIVQEGIVEATISIVFNSMAIVMYLSVDFDGFGLLIALVSVAFVVAVLFGVTQIRKRFRKRKTRRRDSKKDNLHSKFSSNIGSSYNDDSDSDRSNVGNESSIFDSPNQQEDFDGLFTHDDKFEGSPEEAAELAQIELGMRERGPSSDSSRSSRTSGPAQHEPNMSDSIDSAEDDKEKQESSRKARLAIAKPPYVLSQSALKAKAELARPDSFDLDVLTTLPPPSAAVQLRAGLEEEKPESSETQGISAANAPVDEAAALKASPPPESPGLDGFTMSPPPMMLSASVELPAGFAPDQQESANELTVREIDDSSDDDAEVAL
jgi:hypothetical protein